MHSKKIILVFLTSITLTSCEQSIQDPSRVSQNAGPWQTSGTSTYYNSGFVGIGTSNPFTALETVADSSTIQIRMRRTGGSSAFADMGVDSIKGLSFWPDGYGTTSTTPKVVFTPAGDVGIGTTTPGSTLDVRTTSADSTKTSLAAVQDINATTNGTYYNIGAYSVLRKKVNAGVSDLGYAIGVYSSALRNLSTTSDSGFLQTNIGVYSQYGHFNSDAGATPSTNDAYGILISPYRITGTITNMYDIFLGTDSVGGVATNRWGIYQQNTANNRLEGNLGLGMTPTFQLQLSTDSAAKPGTNTWTIASDERLKDIRTTFTRGWEAIKNINPIYYRYKKDNQLNLPSEKEYVGVLAQEVLNKIPEAVSKGKNGYLHLNTDAIFWAMLNTIKELYIDFQGLKKIFYNHESRIKSDIAFLREENIRLKSESEQLKAYICKRDPQAGFCY